MIDVPSELMCSATKDTDPPRNVDEVAAWKLALPRSWARSLANAAARMGGHSSGRLKVSSVILY